MRDSGEDVDVEKFAAAAQVRAIYFCTLAMPLNSLQISLSEAIKLSMSSY